MAEFGRLVLGAEPQFGQDDRNPARQWPKFVHHALLGIDPTRASRRRDARDVEPGFDGMDMGDAQAPDGHLLGWSPGMAPFPGVGGQGLAAWSRTRISSSSFI